MISFVSIYSIYVILRDPNGPYCFGLLNILDPHVNLFHGSIHCVVRVGRDIIYEIPPSPSIQGPKRTIFK